MAIEQISIGSDTAEQWADKTNEVILHSNNYLVATLATGVQATDTANLQASINEAFTAKKALYIPEGTYQIDTALNVETGTGGVILFGDGSARTVINQNTATEHVIDVNVAGASDWDGLVFSDMSLIGGGGTGNGINLNPTSSTGSGLNFSNLVVTNANIAMNLIDIDQAVVRNCKANNSTTGCVLDSSAGVINAVTFLASSFNINTEYGLYIGSGRGVNVIGCEFGPDATAGINLLYWAGQQGRVAGCNFELHAGNTLTNVIRCNNAGSILKVEDCFFNGFGTATITPIKVETQNILHTHGNFKASFASGTPLVSCNITAASVFGSQLSVNNTGTSPTTNSINASGENVTITPFPLIANTTTFTPQAGTRLSMLWKLGNNWNSYDDLQAVIEKTDGAGAATYVKSSLINDQIISQLEDWVSSNPVTSASNLSTVATALEALQTTISNMGL